MDRRLVTLAALAFLAAAFAGVPAWAHHSFAMFNSSKLMTIEGTVKEFSWTNPHVVLWVVANPKDGQPPQTWSFETTSPGNLTRSGWTKRSFAPGDRVRVDFNPLRSGEPGGSFRRAVLLDSGKEVAAPDVRTYGGEPDLK